MIKNDYARGYLEGQYNLIEDIRKLYNNGFEINLLKLKELEKEIKELERTFK